MNYNEILMAAKAKLPNSYQNVVIEIEDLISIGSTGSEIIMMVGKYLKDLEDTNESAYLILKTDIIKYLETCRQNGMLIN